MAVTSSDESGFRQPTPFTSPAKPCRSCLIAMLKRLLHSYCGAPWAGRYQPTRAATTEVQSRVRRNGRSPNCDEAVLKATNITPPRRCRLNLRTVLGTYASDTVLEWPAVQWRVGL